MKVVELREELKKRNLSVAVRNVNLYLSSLALPHIVCPTLFFSWGIPYFIMRTKISYLREKNIFVCGAFHFIISYSM